MSDDIEQRLDRLVRETTIRPIEELMEELDREDAIADHESSGLVFSHSFIASNIETVLAALPAALSRPLPPFPGIFQGISHDPRRALCLSEVAGGTIVFHYIGELPILRELSGELGAISWISADENSRFWAYARIDGRACEVLILDPEQGWRANTWTGEQLVGKGARQYASLRQFLERIRDWYQPVDSDWNIDKWRGSAMRKRLLQSKPPIDKCVEIQWRRANDEFKFRGMGSWDKSRLVQLRRAFQQRNTR